MRKWIVTAGVAAVLIVGAGFAVAARGGDDGDVPEPSSGEIAWEDVAHLLATGEVVSVTQSRSLDVVLLTSGGSYLSTVEPRDGDIFRLAEECGEPCEGVALASE
jgi:hypothetical protein